MLTCKLDLFWVKTAVSEARRIASTLTQFENRHIQCLMAVPSSSQVAQDRLANS